MDDVVNFLFGVIVGVLLLGFATLLLFPQPLETAEFICETHGLELIDYEAASPTFTKVECGNKIANPDYENYKVFTNDT